MMLAQAEAEAKPVFSQDWFSQHIPLWEWLVESHLPSRDKFLEIGSFEGYSACWMLQHALSPTGTLYCVDTWKGSPEFSALDRETVKQSFARFNENVRLSKRDSQQVVAVKNRSIDALAGLIHLEHANSFDLIYIDGSHEAADTLSDAVMAWPLLRAGGLLIFDDYAWDLHRELHRRPKMAIDAFLEVHNEELRTISIGMQAVVKKI